MLLWAIALLPFVSLFLKLPNPNQGTVCQLGPPKHCGIMPPLCCIYVSKWYLTVFNLWSTISSKSFSAQVTSEPWCPVVCIWFCLKSPVLLLSPFSYVFQFFVPFLFFLDFFEFLFHKVFISASHLIVLCLLSGIFMLPCYLVCNTAGPRADTCRNQLTLNHAGNKDNEGG